jgi:hypothetical protein
VTKQFDFLETGSVWNDPGDWTMGLVKKERSLTDFWIFSNPSGCVTGITLETYAEDKNRGYLSISFELRGFEAAAKSVKQKNSEALGGNQ